jgi:predicted regulator of Ras-like GTPase activity (Roadblock/LC7/MglB family)
MQVRRDQTSDENVPQMETPFLQVSKEDSEKFGVPNEPLKASAKPPLRVEAATAPTIAAAEPEASTKFVPIPATAEAIAAANPEAAAAADRVLRIPAPVQPEKPLRIPLATQPVAKGKSETAGKAAPERIAFHLPPKGTGAPASERVPASSGPPVSTDVAPPTRPSTLASGVQLSRKLAVASAPPMPQISTTDDKKISLALKAILQSLPVFELSGDPKEVPEETRVEFPFSLIHSQLSTGRVAVPPELFEKALPPEGRRFFTAKNLQMPVQLPLQEVLRNLPGDALRMRDDQEVREIGETIETPFSTAASEDAERFGAKPQSLSQPEPQLDISPAANVAAPRNDAKSIVEQINALPGVRACSLTFSDGLSLAGALPAEINADALCAVAPSLLERVQTHLVDAQIGELKTITLHCEAATISFLKNANICLTALHANGELTDDVRNKLSEMLAELSRNYPQNEASHVDH